MHPLGDLSKSREDLATGIKIDEEHFGSNVDLGRDEADQLRRRYVYFKLLYKYLYIQPYLTQKTGFARHINIIVFYFLV